jgi:tetratricopeptide (TPR) repeat protein
MNHRIVICLIITLFLSERAFAEDLKGRVVFVGEQNDITPAVGVDITIAETGDSAKTKAAGLFRIALTDKLKVRGSVTLSITEPGWVVQYPLDGETPIPTNLDTLIQVRLLPKGSKKLWSTDRIEKFIRDTAEKAKTQVKPETPKEQAVAIDFGRYIKDWAGQYGFTPQQAKAEIDKWVGEVEKKQEDFYKLGLAEYYKKNFQKAYELATESGERHARAYAQKIQEAETYRAQAMRDYKLAGDAAYSAYRFDDAITAYTQAMRHVSKEAATAWAELQNHLGRANWALGIHAGDESSTYLQAAVAAFRAAMTVYTKEQLPQDWARIQSNLGVALRNQGIRTAGEEGSHLLAEAVAVQRAALTVQRKEQQPQDWAATQNNLGMTLEDQGVRTGGEAGARLLAEAMAAFRAALTIQTKEELPQDWAMTQNNLGIALARQGMRSAGQESSRLLAEAMAAFRAAMTVYTKEQLPEGWAATQNNLANALVEQGIRTGGERGTQLLAEAVAAYRAVLTVRTKEQLPQDWAATQDSLGSALGSLGMRTAGDEGSRLLAEAEAAFRAAMTVYTKEQLPQNWAATQNNLGSSLRDQGIRTSGERGTQLLAEAVAAYRAALTIRTKGHLPQDWAMTQNNLGKALQQQGLRTGGEERTRLLIQAISCYQAALEIRTREHFPDHWAEIQENLGKAYLALEKWEKAAESYGNVLAMYPNYEIAFLICTGIYQEKTFQYTDAFALSKAWLERHPDSPSALANFAEANFTTGRFAEAHERLTAIISNPGLPVANLAGLRALEIANLVGLNRMDSIPDRLKTLHDFIASQPDTFLVEWSFEGAKHFIGQTQVFERHRSWLLDLLSGMEGRKRAEMLVAIEAARKTFVASARP